MSKSITALEATSLTLIASSPEHPRVRKLLDRLSEEVAVIGALIINPDCYIPKQFEESAEELRSTAATIKGLIKPAPRDFEVRIKYVGSSGYVVTASTKEEAEQCAKALYESGQTSDTAASDTEQITDIIVNDMP